MNISDICRHGIVSVDRHACIRVAAAAMRNQHVGTVVVTSADDGVRRAVGILSDRDLAIEVLTRDRDPAQTAVEQIASRRLVSISGEVGVAEAVTEMRHHGVRRLLVTGAEGEIIGIVSADDLLEAVALQLAGLSAALREGVVRETSERTPAAAAAERPVFLPYGTPGMRGAECATAVD